MLDEKLNAIIASIVMQNFPNADRPIKDVDLVNISLEELKFLTAIFTQALPEEVELFADALFNSLNVVNDPKLSTKEKTEQEEEIAGLLERNKNSLVYLNSLNRILIAEDYDPRPLEQLNRPYNFPAPQIRDYPFRDDYTEKLAEAYVLGNTTGTIQYLIKTNNPLFLESVAFIGDVKKAIEQTEGDRLKKRKHLLGRLGLSASPEPEIKAAITQSEKERLRGVMREIDKVEESNVKHLRVEDPLSSPEKTKGDTVVFPIGKNKFTRKHYAIAASLIGFITITTILVYHYNKVSPDITLDKSTTSDTTENTVNRDQAKIDALASLNFDSVEVILTVRKEGAMGFAVKQEKINGRVYSLDRLSALPEFQRQVDSLKKLNKTYTFKDNNLSVYLTNHNTPELYKIDTTYFLKIADTLYHIRQSNKSTLLINVTDGNILDRIDKINYRQDNK